MNIPKDVKYIIDKLNANNYQAYVVGGCVRDSLMGKTPTDYDITTNATPEQITNIFLKTVKTGVKFGTVTVVIDGKNYEVTTFRVDGLYENFRKPINVNFSNNLLDDLSRRDFTINAIAYHPNTGYIDPFSGMSHIKNKIVQAVGNPNIRFNEDALRMLRCIRFASKLGFNTERGTVAAISINAHLMSNISKERIRDELIKMLLVDNLDNLNILNNTHVFKNVHTDLYKYFQENLIRKLSIIKHTKKDAITRLSILFDECSNPKDILKFLKLSNDQITQITRLIQAIKQPLYADSYCIKSRILQIMPQGVIRLIDVKQAQGEQTTQIKTLYDKIIENNEPIYLNQLAINGEILKEYGIAQGKEMGIVLKYLHKCILKEPHLNNKIDLIKKIAQM